jgi:hypothetical protein
MEKENLEALFEFSVMIANMPEEIDQGYEQIDLFRQSRLGEHMLPSDHKIWLYILTILSHPWHWRIWMIQEVKLAQAATLLSEQCVLP